MHGCEKNTFSFTKLLNRCILWVALKEEEQSELSERLTDGCHMNIKATLRAPLSGTFLQTARFSYATEGALFISVQLSTDAVSALNGFGY